MAVAGSEERGVAKIPHTAAAFLLSDYIFLRKLSSFSPFFSVPSFSPSLQLFPGKLPTLNFTFSCGGYGREW